MFRPGCEAERTPAPLLLSELGFEFGYLFVGRLVRVTDGLDGAGEQRRLEEVVGLLGAAAAQRRLEGQVGVRIGRDFGVTSG